MSRGAAGGLNGGSVGNNKKNSMNQHIGDEIMKSIRFATLAALLVSVCMFGSAASLADNWTQSGKDLNNSRHQADETTIDAGNVGSLIPRWVMTTGGDVSANPAVVDGYAYVGDWAGNFYKLDVSTGAPAWGGPVLVSDYTGVPGGFTRNTPAVADGKVIFGDQGGRMFTGAKLVAIDAETAAPVWATQLDPNPTAIVTSSPTVYNGVVYVGVASLEEAFAAFIPGYPCCSFVGSLVAVDLASGDILWKSNMVPEGYSGNAIWGNAPAVDIERSQVYVATGNNYSSPDSYHLCIEAAADETAMAACNVPDNYFDSIIALDLASGAINWTQRVLPYDTWHVGCAPFLIGATEKVNCDYDAGPDFDFGQGPILYRAKAHSNSRDKGSHGEGRGKGKKTGQKANYLGIGQKSGVYWALNPDDGQVIWSTRTGPGGLAGGHQWGSASDGDTIYTSNANSGFQPWTLPNGSGTNFGIFSALNSTDGSVIWQTSNPAFSSAGAPASVANGVVYVCSLDPTGQMFAIDAADGTILWNFASGGSCGGGATIVDGIVLWGSGYSSIGGVANDKLYAFSLP
jgi:polyvinyl alcohol dehydrogenase (cytochrome)